MKSFKKLAGLALAMIMALALMAPAFAAGTDGDITITNPQAGKEYNVYKIFDVTYDDAGHYSYTLPSDSAWKTVVEQFFTVTAQANDPDTSNAVVKEDFSAAAFAEALGGFTSKPDADETWTAGEKPEAHTFHMDELGYFFVTSDAGALCSLTNANPTATITDKNEKPVIEKDDGDEDGMVEVGQTLTYTVTGKVPSTTGYTSYTYTITDTMSTGLTFNKDVSVTIGGETVDSSEWVTYNVNGNANSFELTIPVMDYDVDDAIVVTYTATVNEDAITEVEVTNKASLTYSNDPNDSTKSDKTPDIEVKDYVAKIVVDKYVGNPADETDISTKLNGATFVLRNTTAGDNNGKYYAWDSTNKKVIWVDSVDVATQKTTDTVNGVEGYAEFTGLGSGDYELIEIVAPNGYNLMTTPVSVTIDTDNATVATATDTKSVANYAGAVLPETGGIGTTIFYTLGGLLLVGSVILFVTKKRTGMAD